MTKALCNDLSKKILQDKYMTEGEKTPDDLFLRCARVCSIPDVIDLIINDTNTPQIYNISEPLSGFRQYRKLADKVWQRRSKNKIKTSSFTATRVKELWEQETEKYYKEMCELNFMPASPILMNSGNFGMLSSCFFLRVEDSMDGIFDAVKRVGIISKAGGGVGLDFSLLRPEGSKIKGTGGTSSGPISFMEVFNATGETVKQGGRRKGALLASLRIDHPDIVKFIKCKEREGKLNNFNISVLVTDDFMEKLNDNFKKNMAFVANFKDKEYVIKKDTGDAVEFTDENEKDWNPPCYSVQDVWDLICENALFGEPGCVFVDTVNRADPLKGKYGPLGQNACSELHLVNYDSCNLASINLANCVNEAQNDLDYSKLEKLVHLGIRFLDNVIDLNNYPFPETEKISLKLRRLGLGVFGLHDCLLKLKVRYGSEAGMAFIHAIWSMMQSCAYDESSKLRELRGVFPAFEEIEVWSNKVWYNRRNIGLLTCMPTGTTSFIANQASSGIEPVFQWEYKRKDSYGEHAIRHWMLDEYEEIPKFAKNALEISPEDHVKVQATIQNYVDSGISKTVNLPITAMKEDVDKVFKLAYELGCKSITVYRTGSRKEEVLVKENKLDQNPPLEQNVKQPDLVKEEELNKDDGRQSNIRKRPKVLFGATIKINTSSGPAYITLNEDVEGLRECLISASKAGSEVGVHTAVEGRLISNSLQYRVPIESIIQHLKNQKSSPIWESGETVKSLPDAIAKAIEFYRKNYEGFSEYLPDDVIEVSKEEKVVDEPSGELCPECGENLYMEGGCDVCKSCGYSTCS